MLPTTAANKLAAQNELLKAQTEQLRGQSQLDERMRSIQALQEEIGRYNEQLRHRDAESESVSNELWGVKAVARGL